MVLATVKGLSTFAVMLILPGATLILNAIALVGKILAAIDGAI
jgi:hypothetical protein